MRLQWDLFCRVVDNYGDIGVSWRLARDLAARGQTVRLWLDDACALAWMAPDGAPQGIEVLAWDDADHAAAVGDIVIETFGCELPPAFVARMAARPMAPQWINLEYLSAEPYVERSHGLASPQFSGPGAGLAKRFFYPGFTPRTGGLLREPELLQRQQRFDAPSWLAAQGIAPQPGERLVSLFAYPNPALPALLQSLADTPTLLLVCPGAAQTQIAGLALPPTLRWRALPYLSQPEFDHLLWACDLNFVRGEDSFVRAQWAAKPFVWQIYPQQDGAHGQKLEAFMDLWLADATAELAAASRSLWRAWNALTVWPACLPPAEAAQRHAQRWRSHLAAQADLSAQLLRFIGVSG
ncbi:elongation factor P maturation arginine rhamnosyltransferase EarP [Paucibacter sp. PLA-PC-4]|uniref:elongation factor P maturation arginine rhamnosyltransferase EarP n=1 Tax=Paucibacter sp. PLA-PC-4 TaxID=2993655 RepID=UPI00224B003C|nr:elongation factor P maturation arginine rhamnosyltransferase EarP [Paucibacter sp. PLA-PC-4]MCX2865183.1 elongation factor P maturation arginine rhamnosyltransferase EarP [Paucibacter sp. PLA-PC-4]